MTYQEAVEWLEAVPLYGHKDGLNNMYRIMEKLGNPQKRFRVIHVAGTNGKGSCCSMLQEILREAGYKVGLYTSPHLVDYRERIRTDGQWIPQDAFAEALASVRACNDELVVAGYPHATFFEFLTAMAFVYFAEKMVDYVVLETGVGGRLDSTNIIEDPVACLITSISLDHTKVLGDTLTAIAGEKAGIIKPGVPVVAGENPEEVLEVIRQRASECGSVLTEATSCKLCCLEETDQNMVLAPLQKTDDLPERIELPMVGEYQLQNTASVLSVVRVLREQGLRISNDVVFEALKRVSWPGRMQTETAAGRNLILEGAHNEDGAAWLGRYIGRRSEPVTLVFSTLGKKDSTAVLKGIVDNDKIAEILFAPIDDEFPLTADGFAEVYQRLGLQIPYTVYDSVPEMMEATVSDGTNRTIICAGSLYLVGEIMRWLNDRR